MATKKKTRKRDYDEEYADYHGTPAQKKKRAKRNAARAKLAREGAVKKGDGREVDHKKPLRKGGSNARSNLKVKDAAKNRGWRKGKKGYD